MKYLNSYKLFEAKGNPVVMTEEIIKEILSDVTDNEFIVEVLTDSATPNIYKYETFEVAICTYQYQKHSIEGTYHHKKMEDIENDTFALDEIKSSINQLINNLSDKYKINEISTKLRNDSGVYSYTIPDIREFVRSLYVIRPADKYTSYRGTGVYSASDKIMQVINIEFKPK